MAKHTPKSKYEKRDKVSLQNFAQYRINGMIANLHRIYYERRKDDPALLTKIGCAIDCLTELKTVLKEHNNDDASK